MKTLVWMIAAMLALPLASAWANEEKAADPVEACKAKAAFNYHFEMMEIEGEELRGSILHSEAGERKGKRHKKHLEALEECDELKRD